MERVSTRLRRSTTCQYQVQAMDSMNFSNVLSMPKNDSANEVLFKPVQNASEVRGVAVVLDGSV